MPRLLFHPLPHALYEVGRPFKIIPVGCELIASKGSSSSMSLARLPSKLCKLPPLILVGAPRSDARTWQGCSPTRYSVCTMLNCNPKATASRAWRGVEGGAEGVKWYGVHAQYRVDAKMLVLLDVPSETCDGFRRASSEPTFHTRSSLTSDLW